MTMQASVRPQPPMPDQENVASSIGEAPPKGGLAVRGYSDSLVPSCLASQEKKSELEDPMGLANNDRSTAGNMQETGLLSPQVKPRFHLHLPSFKSLGIASRLPDTLLTPPDESTTESGKPAPLSYFNRSSSFPPSMPKTPSPDINDLAPNIINMLTLAGTANMTQAAISAAETGVIEHEQEGTGPLSSSSEEDPLPDHDHPGWLMEALEAVVNAIDLNSLSYALSLLCHSQPCPLSDKIVEGILSPNVASAYRGLLSAVQNKVNATGCWIDVSHAVPIKFNMAQIPSSPAATLRSQNAAQDYMNAKPIVRLVVAMEHSQAMMNAVPSSPRPVVPPSSVNVSLLERFIPPSTAKEYLDLFAQDQPSELVNRLHELSPRNGSLIFIYPTGTGASTFDTTYLGPLIHPLLRAMCSVHGLSMDLGSQVGRIAAVDQMVSFERMTQKLNTLLRRLGRGTSTAMHRPGPNPKYTLMWKSTQVIQLERKVWTEWWAQQESGRIRNSVERYLSKGIMMPIGKDVTAATLVQEVLDGVRSTRSYAEYDEAREGIEVGVFVIKRTA